MRFAKRILRPGENDRRDNMKSMVIAGLLAFAALGAHADGISGIF